jgi:hypothetical protein
MAMAAEGLRTGFFAAALRGAAALFFAAIFGLCLRIR